MHVTMTPDAFIARLAPRAQRNTTIYFGLLAAHAKGREEIVPCPEDERGVPLFAFLPGPVRGPPVREYIAKGASPSYRVS